MKKVPSDLADIALQTFLVGCLFFSLTGGGLLIGWESIRPYRDGHYVLVVSLALIGFCVAWGQYFKSKKTFFALEPGRSINAFFSSPPGLSLFILFGFYFATQFLCLVFMHKALETALYDLGLYDQVIWNTAHGNFLITSVRGGIHIFYERFKPMLALLAPIYLFGNDINVLFLLTTLITSTSIIAVYLVAKIVTRSHNSALVLAICVLFYLPMRNGINFLFHTQVLADPLILFGFCAALRQRSMLALSCFALALMCKESIAVDVFGIGLFCLSKKEPIGWKIIALALADIALIVFVIKPHFEFPTSVLNKWNFYSHLFSLEPQMWMRLLTPNPLVFMLLIFGPFSFLPLKCKGWVWLLGPSLAFRLLGAWPGFRMITAHYTAGLNALIFISTAYGVSSWLRTRSADESTGDNQKRWFQLLRNQNGLYTVLILCAIMFARTPQIFKMDRYLWEASKLENQRVIRVLKSIPETYSVLTNERFSAHLTHRPYLYVFLSMFKDAPLQEASKKPDIIVVDEERISSTEREVLNEFTGRGYRPIFSMDFIRIFERPHDNPVIPPELLKRWEEYRNSPQIPYRAIVRFWYRWFLSFGAIILLIRLLKKTVSNFFASVPRCW